MDAEIERLLKKRQNGFFSEKDTIRLQELIDTREAIEVKYHLTPEETGGFETIAQKVEAEVARAQARGKTDADKAGTLETELRLGDRLLKKGMSGNDVRELQLNLLKLGYALPKYGADGGYGMETVEAVKAFQKKNGLEADGVYGSNTHKSLLAALESLKEPKPVLTTVVILSAEDGSVNVRTGNGTQYAILRSAKAGDMERPFPCRKLDG